MTGRTRSVSIYRSLLGNLALVIVLLSAAIMALTFVGSQQTVRRLSGMILRETIGQIDLELRHFFDPVIRNLHLLRAWDESGLLDMGDAAAMNRLLIPLLRATPQLSAVLVADERGWEHSVFHFGDTWRSRQTRRDVWSNRAAWLEWMDGRPEPVASWMHSDYDPRQRPWYQGAMDAHRPAASGPTEAGAPPLRIHWTMPYTFYTAKAPGLTAAVALPTKDRADARGGVRRAVERHLRLHHELASGRARRGHGLDGRRPRHRPAARSAVSERRGADGRTPEAA